MKLMFPRLAKNKETHNHLAHDAFFNELRKKEFNRLDETGHIYLDYTGGNLYSASQIRKHHELLLKNTFGNPHSTNPTSSFSTRLVDSARSKVLHYFNAEDYYCIFTGNASGAMKIVGECYPFEEQGCLVLSFDNHNSVNGMREYCRLHGGSFAYSKIQYEDLRLDNAHLNSLLDNFADKKNKLLAFPAQSNVSGVKHDLAWISKAQSKGWDVLLDAAAYVPTNKLDLSFIRPDFVSISFYKIFGYPTGIGCLLVRKDKFFKLHKRWFAGGTVTMVSVLSPHHYLAKNHERFEDGTINYLDLPSIKTGLEFIESIGIERINERISSLISYLYDNLKEIRHDNGLQIVRLFGPEDRKNVGGTLIMTFINPDGSLIPFEEIDLLINNRNISIRTGCFCNPGIDEVNSCLSTTELEAFFSSRENGDYNDMKAFLHKMRGAIRVSVGIATVQTDIDAFISFVKGMRNRTVAVNSN
jgi:selenocysteine lyase/cysteine desulfurase